MKKEFYLAKDKDENVSCYSEKPKKAELFWFGNNVYNIHDGFKDGISFEDEEPKKIVVTDEDVFGEIKTMKEGILDVIKTYLGKVEIIDEMLSLFDEENAPEMFKVMRGSYKAVIIDLKNYYETIKNYGKEED